MRVSLNTIRQYIDFELPPLDELVKKINEQLGGVEETIDLSLKYKDPIVVRIVSAEQHPNADRLRVCKVDDGGAVADVPRDEDGYVQVVCGAPNARADILAVWLPPASTVPSSFDDAEPFVLAARELRGVVSQGMLAAGDELALNSNHDGIVELDENEWKPNDVELKPGASFAKAFGLDDTIIEIENKMFTHRPDLFGQIGVAREIAGILGHRFTSPQWYINAPLFEQVEGLELDVFNEAPDKVPRFMAVALKNITIKPSPIWLQCALVAMGSKSINNIVDVTNYVMLITAQPTHAYDYDKIRGHKLGARLAQAGETALLLNGKTYQLDTSDIVIADGEGVIGLAGIMGGGNSEVTADTTAIVLEVATFDMYTIRKSSMRHGVFTDALTRFNKGQSPLQNDHILNLLMMSIKDVSSAEQASEVYDLKGFEDDHEDSFNNRWTPHTLTAEFINERLGTKLLDTEMVTLLESVEFHKQAMNTQGEISVTAPFWRTDIELPEDIVEEIGRLYGFDKLPRALPMRSIRPATVNQKIVAKRRIRDVLASSGANEVLTYSFVHENVLRKAAQNPEEAFRLSNALSPDLQYYRLSVLPSVLSNVHANIKTGHDEFALFEIGKGHHVESLDEAGLPREFDRVAIVYAAKKSKTDGAPYFMIRRYVDTLLASINAVDVHFVKLADFDYQGNKPLIQLAAPFDPNRSAAVMIGESFAGFVGGLKTAVHYGFKLPYETAACELFLSAFLNSAPSNYKPLSRFPSVSRDISMKVSSDVSYHALQQAIYATTSAAPYDVELSPLTIYQPEQDTSAKTISFRLKITSDERTLREDEATLLLDQVVAAAHTAVGAERV